VTQVAQREQLAQRVQLVLKEFKAFKASLELKEAAFFHHHWQIPIKWHSPRHPLGV
jgi:hypothetical protein